MALLTLESSRENLTLTAERSEVNLKNGFACPQCGEELYDIHPGGILESMPAQKGVTCECGFKGLRYVAND